MLIRLPCLIAANSISQAMAIVNERYMAARPVQVDPKTGKPIPGSSVPLPRPATPVDGVDPAGSGFFGSFFASKNKKKLAAMEAPPPSLKASGTLSEKESQEVEVISTYNHCLRTPADPRIPYIGHNANRSEQTNTLPQNY